MKKLFLVLAFLPSCNSVTHVKRTSQDGSVTEWDGINSVMVRRKAHTSRITRADGTIIEDFGDEDSTRAGSLMLWDGAIKQGLPVMGDIAKKALP